MAETQETPHKSQARVCGMSGETGDLPWPLSFKLLPDAEEIAREKRTSFRLPSSHTLDLTSGKVCEAWFNFKGNRKCLQWQGPEKGQTLLKQIAQAYRIQLRDDGHPTGKLIFIVDTETMEVVDVDSPLVQGNEYKVHVEPEDSTPFNIMPCFLSLCTHRNFPRANYLGD
mmetsp:Transcript_76538/g.112116  ORF Transcript_76538/g.112116 Transcript_76538/m.112116 type:complete len:170 (-) Transcript_76538:16-525(-)